MTPLSKDFRCVILPFVTYGTHLDASSKTVDMELEMRKKKEIKTAGEILAEIWSESTIDDHPVKTAYSDEKSDISAWCVWEGGGRVDPLADKC